MITTRYILLIASALWSSTLQAQDNSLTKAEKKEGWKLLFDGKSTKGWRNYNKQEIGPGWQVVDGTLYLDSKLGKGGDILYSGKEFENFELSIEWKIDSCGNSGIFFNAAEAPKYKYGYYTGPEMQILDSDCHPDGKISKHRAGNLYDLIPSVQEANKKWGEWNRVRIVSNKGHLELWQNDVKQAETEMYTPEWAEMIKGSKFKAHPDFGTYRKGYIMLQDHGDRVWFRNIKIREL